MTPEQEYEMSQGTLFGEIRHEVYSKYGLEAYGTSKYFWSGLDVSETVRKHYTLVNTTPTRFLVATVTFPMVDITPIDPSTGKKLDIPAHIVPDWENPTHLDLKWVDANVPFLDRHILDEQGITYNLP